MTILRRVLLPWAATAVLLMLCLMPKSWFPHGETGPKLIPHLDKVIHFGMFASFGLFWACAGGSPVPTRWRIVAVLAAAFALAVATELAQSLPRIDRDPDAFDALADAAGAVVAVAAVVSWAKVRAGGPEG